MLCQKKFCSVSTLKRCILPLLLVYLVAILFLNFNNIHTTNTITLEKKADIKVLPDVRVVEKVTKPSSTRRGEFTYSATEPQATWRKNEKVFCNGAFSAYDGLFAKLENVLVDPSKANGSPGGESIEDVLNQSESNEYFKYQHGYMNVICNQSINYAFKKKTHLQQWLTYLKTLDNWNNFTNIQHIDNFTIAVVRYEYANIYLTLSEMFNAYLTAKLFDMDPSIVTILLVDGHPKGALDSMWSTLFGKVIRAGTLKQPALLKQLIWSPPGFTSPMRFLPTVPWKPFENFRNFILKRYDLPTFRQLDCKSLNILFIWRHDYLAHPRRPDGHVQRKIKNEEELLTILKSNFPEQNVNGIQIDTLDLHAQLKMVSDTDILVGMHGAGLTHSMFLQLHAGLIELFPMKFVATVSHMKDIAVNRHLHYKSWQNKDKRRDIAGDYTNVPPEVVQSLVKEIITNMCN